MFDYSLVHWVPFFTVALLLHLSPGPDMAFILGQPIKGGRVKGFSAMGGIWTGAACHALKAAFGLSANLMTSATAFLMLKWIGAVYLVWLGIQAIRSKGSSFLSNIDLLSEPESSNWSIFRQGLMVSLLNPKMAIFHGVSSTVCCCWCRANIRSNAATWLFSRNHCWCSRAPIILVAARLADSFRASKKFGLWMDRCLGCLLIGLGIKLATSNR